MRTRVRGQPAGAQADQETDEGDLGPGQARGGELGRRAPSPRTPAPPSPGRPPRGDVASAISFSSACSRRGLATLAAAPPCRRRPSLASPRRPTARRRHRPRSSAATARARCRRDPRTARSRRRPRRAYCAPARARRRSRPRPAWRQVVDRQVGDRPRRLHEVGANPAAAGPVGAVELHVAARRVPLRLPVEQLGVKVRGAREVGALELDVNDRGTGHSQRPYQHVAKMATSTASPSADRAEDQHHDLTQLDRRSVDVAGQPAEPPEQPEREPQHDRRGPQRRQDQRRSRARPRRRSRCRSPPRPGRAPPRR